MVKILTMISIIFYKSILITSEGNDHPHNSLKLNIFHNIFPKYYDKYCSIFKDDIINQIKQLIWELNQSEEKQDKNALKKRMDKITENIKKLN